MDDQLYSKYDAVFVDVVELIVLTNVFILFAFSLKAAIDYFTIRGETNNLKKATLCILSICCGATLGLILVLAIHAIGYLG